ncbi:MazG nucleotide pyrophosphohydrolase domain-containing protein [Vallitalea okinawensis]|uniref:MazG nucleotide pyrophosphohydrolase domain-containing protein n=1 Tax=Vallitalea okinawensis TaxID=2078660 RepID=UPI001FA8FC1D|nr:MazG nucleotide pyrophosphohydrolase domain-containing protein [Vallitalea okinawensis]
MNINYNNKRFKSVINTDNGEVNHQTIFKYFQKDDLVWAEYSGGGITKGYLIANVDDTGNLDMRYQHVNSNGELMTGKCFSQPKVLEDGRIQLHEKWEWTSGDHSKGESIVEEFKWDDDSSSKKPLSIVDMQKMSYDLWNENKDTWSPMEPAYGKDFILYMIEEIGEVIQVIKKKKVDLIMSDPYTREKFIEELCDVQMYYIDVLNRYHITPEEFRQIYLRKFRYNMKRDYKKDHSELFKTD